MQIILKGDDSWENWGWMAIGAGLFSLLFPMIPPWWSIQGGLYGALLLMRSSHPRWKKIGQFFWIVSWILQNLSHRQWPVAYLDRQADRKKMVWCQATLEAVQELDETTLASLSGVSFKRYCLIFSISKIFNASLSSRQHITLRIVVANAQNFLEQDYSEWDLYLFILPKPYFNEGSSRQRLSHHLFPQSRAKLLKAQRVHYSKSAKCRAAFDHFFLHWIKWMHRADPFVGKIILIFFSKYHRHFAKLLNGDDPSSKMFSSPLLLHWILYHLIRQSFQQSPFRGTKVINTILWVALLFFYNASFLSFYSALILGRFMLLRIKSVRVMPLSALFFMGVLLHPWMFLAPSALFFFIFQKIFHCLMLLVPRNLSHQSHAITQHQQWLVKTLIAALSALLTSALETLFFDEANRHIYLLTLRPFFHYFFILIFPVVALNGLFYGLHCPMFKGGKILLALTIHWIHFWGKIFETVLLIGEKLYIRTHFGILLMMMGVITLSALSGEPLKKCSKIYSLLWKSTWIAFQWVSIIETLGLMNDPDFYVDMLDVGHGLAIVIRKKSHALLIDTAATYGSFCLADRIILPYLECYGLHLDGLFITHSDHDHAGGLPLLHDCFPTSPIYASMPLPNCSVPPYFLKAGHVLSWQDAEILVLWPERVIPYESKNRNNDSLILLIKLENFFLLVTGDIDKTVESALKWPLKKRIEPLALQIPHHGSKKSSHVHFLRAIAPEIAINSCSNRQGFFDPCLQERFRKCNIPVRSTHQVGRIRLFHKKGTLYFSGYREEFFKYWWKK